MWPSVTNDRKSLLAIAALAVVLCLLASCAHRPQLWELCRDECARRGGDHAAVVGDVKAEHKPACLCATADPS